MVTSLPLDAASSTIARMMKIIMIPTMTAVSRTGLRQGLNIMAVTIISLDAKGYYRGSGTLPEQIIRGKYGYR